MLRDDYEKRDFQTREQYEAALDGVYKNAYENGNPNTDLMTKSAFEKINNDLPTFRARQDETKQILVKSNFKPIIDRFGDEMHNVVLFERNENHEGGECYIADSQVHRVAATALVIQRLGEGELVEVE